LRQGYSLIDGKCLAELFPFIKKIKNWTNYPQHLKKISHYQKISKAQILETEMIFIFQE